MASSLSFNANGSNLGQLLQITDLRDLWLTGLYVLNTVIIGILTVGCNITGIFTCIAA